MRINMFDSVSAYSGLELSQLDNLFSWFYSVIKILTGELPWDDFIDERSKTCRLKAFTSIEQLTKKMPHEFINIIIGLAINKTPNYSKIAELIILSMEEN